MKQLLVTLCLALTMGSSLFAQNERVTPMTDRSSDVPGYYDNDPERIANYEKLVRAQYEVDLRGVAVRALGLNEEETEDFTPWFMQYMEAKKALMERRANLVAEYKEEMKEDDTMQDEENETADFIENYWEEDIAEMELMKDYFDKFEDRIGTEKALSFFRLEKMYADRLQRMALLKTLPARRVLYVLEPVTYSYETPVRNYNNWNKINLTGNVSLSHDYTYNGLSKLMNAVGAMAAAENITVDNWTTRKEMVLDHAEKLTENWKSLNHADYARKAFTETAAILKEVAMDSRFSANQAWISKLNEQAAMIKPDVKLTDQADAVNGFFTTAQYIVNDLVEQANGMSK